MAIGEIPPWVRGVNAEQAISAGASAGLGAARIQQEGENEAQRMGMEAMRLKQSTAMEQARLQQAAEQHQMEFQARQKINEQMQLRSDQRLNIENAYKTSAIGIQQGRLEEAQKVADEKAKNAAIQFQREQGFARDVSSGVPAMEAYRRNPVAASILNSATRSQLREDQTKSKYFEGKFPIIKINPATGQSETVYTPPKSEGLSKGDLEDLKDLRHERDTITKRMGDKFQESIVPTPPAELKKTQDKLDEINQKIEAIKRPKLKSPTATTSKDKVVRAHALGIAHPDWTKEQIIDAVEKEMQ